MNEHQATREDIPVAVPGQDIDRQIRRHIRDCGDFDIHIGRDGTWYYRGSPIQRPPLVRLFASVLEREADGQYWLVTPAERGRITVEDVPFIAVEMTVEGQGSHQILSFRTNIDDRVVADEDHPLRVMDASGEPSPYILVRKNLEARLTRAVFYQLVDLAVEQRVGEERVLGVWSAGKFFVLGPAD
jgi:hypothetical protein